MRANAQRTESKTVSFGAGADCERTHRLVWFRSNVPDNLVAPTVGRPEHTKLDILKKIITRALHESFAALNQVQHVLQVRKEVSLRTRNPVVMLTFLPRT